jgi:hypothetical protein
MGTVDHVSEKRKKKKYVFFLIQIKNNSIPREKTLLGAPIRNPRATERLRFGEKIQEAVGARVPGRPPPPGGGKNGHKPHRKKTSGATLMSSGRLGAVRRINLVL